MFTIPNLCICLILVDPELVSCKNILAKEFDEVLFICPFRATTKSIIWLGPEKGKLTTYCVGVDVNPDLSNFDRISIEGNHLEGIFDLKIVNVTKKDVGEYICQTIAHGTTVQSKFNLKIIEKPKPVEDKETIKLETHIDKPAMVKVLIESLQMPSVSWKENAGGKVGKWSVKNYGISTFIISSTIVPTERIHFGTYGIRVRNDAGSIDLQLELQLKDFQVTIEPQEIHCNLSSEFTIICHLREESIQDWENTWIHSRKHQFIETIKGEVEGNTSILHIHFCDYRDEGDYKCTWSSTTKSYSATSNVIAYGPPTLIKKEYLMKENSNCLAVQFYSLTNSVTTQWFKDDRVIEETTRMKHVLNTVMVKLNFSDKSIAENGFRSKLCASNFSYSDIMDYSCQIRNNYGSIEITFSRHRIQELYQQVLNKDLFSKTTEAFENKNETGIILYSITGMAVFIVLAVAVVAGVLTHKRIFGKAYEISRRHRLTSQQDFPEETENEYEEIVNTRITHDLNVEVNEQLQTSEGSGDQTGASRSVQVGDIIDVQQNQYFEMDDAKLDHHSYYECQ